MIVNTYFVCKEPPSKWKSQMRASKRQTYSTIRASPARKARELRAGRGAGRERARGRRGGHLRVGSPARPRVRRTVWISQKAVQEREYIFPIGPRRRCCSQCLLCGSHGDERPRPARIRKVFERWSHSRAGRRSLTLVAPGTPIKTRSREAGLAPTSRLQEATAGYRARHGVGFSS